MNDPQAKPKPRRSARPSTTSTGRSGTAAGAGELLLQRCAPARGLRYPAAVVCPKCLSGEARVAADERRGTVFSFVVFHRAYHPAWEGKVPYTVALIELDEGPIMLSNVVGVDPAKVAVGLPVEVAFEPQDEALAIPVFRPA